jgi:hypothetical protein
MDVEKSTVQMFSWTVGVYDPDFLAIHEDRGKRGKVCNALVYFVNLVVVNDHGSSDGVSSVDRYLSLHCYFGILGGSFLLIQGC